MELQLEGKTALVTGSTAGIGFAIAKMLAHEGATVLVNGRSEERVNRAIQEISAESPRGKVLPAPADLSCKEATEALLKKYSSVDILINNLGIYEPKPFQEIEDEEWIRFFEVNVLSGVRLSRAYLPSMREKNWGRIVFISSESGVQIPIEMIHYGMTKTAQLAVSRGLAELTAGTGVTVNAVLPGPTLSEGVGKFIAELQRQEGKDEATFEKHFFTHVRPSSLLKRFTTSEEVAAMVTYVCSPLASATNGASLRVDGGVVRSIV